jgi:succinate-semialdehyde dehydrogenase / glutarate-semialdehyde dehydrogenase
MRAVNPATGELIEEYPDHEAAEVERRLAVASETFARWGPAPFAERRLRMQRVAQLLRERSHDLAALMAKEMGKPVREGAAEIEKCAWAAEFFAERAESYLSDGIVATDAKKSYVAYLPLGVVLAIMPWNFPFWQVFRFAAPALMAGNVALVKHAPSVPGSARAIEALFADAGFPPGVLQILFVSESSAGALIDDPRVVAVTLTGSTRAGRAVAARAGHALKKTVLELGGSDPYVVLEDADVSRAASISVAARLINAGQSCIAAKRFVVVDAVRAEFEDALTDGMKRAIVGDPMDPRTEVGPLARVELRDALHAQVVASIERGARLLLGGVVPSRPGAWYPPTVLADVAPGMPAFDQEVFGPVAAIVPAADEAAAISLANATSYGLGAAVLTGDDERGERIARDGLAAGACFVNAQVRSDPRLPFGGIRNSGYGRELGAFGIREFTNVKAVWIA